MPMTELNQALDNLCMRYAELTRTDPRFHTYEVRLLEYQTARAEIIKMFAAMEKGQ